MKLIQETPQHLVYLDYFQGQQVRILKDKLTGEISFNSDDVAKVLGFKDHNDMVRNGEIQALMIQHQLEKGTPIFKEADYNNHVN